MSIKHLRTLVAVSEHETFSKAATAVFLTHAAVSQQMRQLEAECGIALFDRSKRTPRLNAKGHALVARARALLRDYDALVPSILDDAALTGEITLGAVPTTLTGLVPVALAGLKERCPDLHLRLRPGLTGALLTALERHELDAALVSRPFLEPAGITFEDICVEPLKLIASEQSRSSDPDELLRTRPFIRFNRDAVVGTQIEHWIQARGLRVREAMELDNLDAIASMVHANLGVSIVPEVAVLPFNPLPLQWLPLGADAPSRALCIAFPSDTAKRSVIRALRAALLRAINTPARRDKSRTLEGGAE